MNFLFILYSLVLIQPFCKCRDEEEEESYQMKRNPSKAMMVNLRLAKLVPSLKESTENRFREYAIAEVQKVNIPVPSNIDYFDLHLFERPFYKHKCHFIVNNYNNVNLKLGLHPILIRRPVLTRYDKIVHEIPTWQPLIWVPYGLLHKDTNLVSEKTHHKHCHKSKYLSPFETHGSFYSPDICIRINLPIYSAQSKPWNCQVDLHLLPSVLILDKVNYPRSFKIPRESSFNNLRIMLPSLRPSYVLLIDWVPLYNIEHIKYWISYSKTWSPDDDASPLVTYTDFVLYRRRQNLKWDASSLTSGLNGIIHFRNFDFKFVSQVDHGKDGELNTAWEFGIIGRYLGDYHMATLHNLYDCGIDIKYEHTNRANLPASRFDGSRLYLGIAITWLKIWGNYSFKNFQRKLCDNGIATLTEYNWDTPAEVMTHITEPSRTLYFPFGYNDSLQNIKFVSCGGTKGEEPISFSDMYNIFDGWIWACTAASTCIVAAALNWSLNVEKIKRHSISRVWHSVKIYLEQGGPYPDKVNINSKPIIVTTLFVGIVLSNAYKNANVYNMILPRKVIPFTDITELIANQFNIYTKPLLMEESYYNSDKPDQVFLNKSGGLFCGATQHSIQCKNLFGRREYVSIQSEIDFISSQNLFNTKTKNGVHIEQIAKLMPLQAELNDMHRLIRSMPKNQKIHIKYDKAFREFLKSVEFGLYKELEKCNRTAAVVTEYVARRYEKRLKRLNMKHVFVGKDRYFDANHGFYLQGKMHRNVAKRIQAFKVSGILDWWPKYEQNHFAIGRELSNQDIPTPSMQGNIQVIFYLLAIGLFISIIVLLFESHLLILAFSKYVYLITANLVRRMLSKINLGRLKNLKFKKRTEVFCFKKK